MPRRRGLPPYRFHKHTGQALVHVNGRDVYLGPHGSEESKRKYEEIIRKMLAGQASADVKHRALVADTLTVRELIPKYLAHARSYYQKNGRLTSEYQSICSALRPLREQCEVVLARNFGPKHLKQFRNQWVEQGVVRSQINKRVDRVRRMFRWAVAEELLEPAIFDRLKTVEGLRKGRTHAIEGKPVQPVDDAVVDATLPFLNRQVRALVELLRLTGARPAELVIMRTIDLDTSGDVWTYSPTSFKTQHHERPRVIPLGPKAQEIIRPWLRLNVSEYLFQPLEAEAERHAAQRAGRQTPLYPSHVKHLAGKRVQRPQRAPREHYDSASLRRAISWALVKANRARKAEGLPEIPDWFPYQLRHSLATKVERMFGLEASKACLGHASAEVTSKFYVERQDQARAAEVASKIG